MDAIHTKDLIKSYGDRPPALKGISLTIPQGQVVALLGPSGVGKSTFLRCLNFLVRPTSGEVWLGGTRVDGLSEKELRLVRSRVGMIFQEFNLVGRLSVLTNVLCGQLGKLSAFRALTCTFPAGSVADAVGALRRVGLDDPDLYLRRADTLSGGQKQRVAIARALLQNPTVLLADEPIASLDVKMQRVILELIVDVVRSGNITAIISLHHVDLAKEFADRIVAFGDGNIAFDGPPEELSRDIISRVFKLDEMRVA